MIRNLKVIGVVMAAFVAMSALSASSAFAEPEFHCEEVHCLGKAVQESDQVFTTKFGVVTCKKVAGDFTVFGTDGSGNQTVASTTMEITATDITYSECTTTTIFGKINVTVDFKGCDYLFTTSTQPVHLVCGAGSGPITISGPGCTITVPGGQTLSEVHYTNIGEGTTREITVNATVKNITAEAAGAFCSATGHTAVGEYTGNIKVTGESTAGVHKGIWYL